MRVFIITCLVVLGSTKIVNSQEKKDRQPAMRNVIIKKLKTMKNKLIIPILLLTTTVSFAQSFLPADNTTSEAILRKHLKAMFIEECTHLKKESNPDSILNDITQRGYGDFLIRQTTYGFGDWVLKPSFHVFKLNIKSPWEDYEIYKLEIPRYTSRNDSIAGYFGYRDLFSNENNSTNPLRGENLLAFNYKKNKVMYLDWPNNVLFHRSESFFFKKIYPNLVWEDLPDLSYAEKPILSPSTDIERKKFLVSELMKNIYCYRLIKSGILDSLVEKQNIIKEQIDQFPLIDSLIPNFDENLYFKAEKIIDNGTMEYWRFEYPGYDSLYNRNEGWRNTFWEKYIKLQRQYYVIGYNLKRELVSFISGNFYLSRFSDYYFPSNERKMLKFDSLEFAYNRERYVKSRALSLCPDIYYNLTNKSSCDSNGEDENYWYFILHSAIPYYHLISFYDDDGTLSKMCCAPPNYKFCDYHLRLNKRNWEIVEIMNKPKCFDK
jgi:hypothetical protein